MGGELGSPLAGVSRAIVLVTGKAAGPPPRPSHLCPLLLLCVERVPAWEEAEA